MNYYNIHNKKALYPLSKVIFSGSNNEKDLYMPSNIPQLDKIFFTNIKGMSLQKIGKIISKHFFAADIDEHSLNEIVEKALNFPIPLKQLDDNIYVLELFHGPTQAFKDVGARYMAGMLDYFLRNENKEINILVATSGDTGGAVANAFHNKEGFNVTILYPSGKVSELQEKQLTSLGRNIRAFEVKGTFDDCQRMVKQAFADKELNSQLNLTSANSINLARLIPQSFYYFYAFSQLPRLNTEIAISVPCGNFGNITGGLLAKKMGLPVKHFIASTNQNDIIPEYLKTGIYEPRPSISTISNAMDVGNPSNFARMLDIYHKQFDLLQSDVKGFSFSNKETYEAMKELKNIYNYVADPHGAVAYTGLMKYGTKNKTGIFLETAHPAKFPEVVEKALGKKPEIPNELLLLKDETKHSILIDADYLKFKDCLMGIKV